MKISICNGIKCTEKELNDFLSIFNLIEALRVICKISLSYELNFCSTDIAYRLVLYANDNNLRLMTREEGYKAYKMTYHLQNDKLNLSSHCEILLKLANQQFDDNESPKYDIARTLHLYQNLWNVTTETKSIDIQKSIKQITNLNLTTLLAINYAFGGQAQKYGYITKYGENSINTLSTEHQEIFKEENQKKFLDYCSIDYENIRTFKNKEINPLKIYPLINTHTIPNGLSSYAYLVPSQYNLIKKTTTNLYYSLADKYKSKKGNEFKTAFGFVFEAYVKSIFRDCLKSWTVCSEITYDKKKNLKTIDLLISKGKKIILVEIKQQSLYASTKNKCEAINIKKDLRKTLTKGVRQIFKTEALIESKNNQALKGYNNIKFLQRLIVTYIPLREPNSIIKDIIKEDISDYPNNKDFHIINIDELETLLSCQKESESLFDLLHFKEIDFPAMEFNEFIPNQFPNYKQFKIEALEKIENDFLNPLINGEK
ncbi:MAG: hypothetical protein K8R54_09260 [Bacteroidales bacterium]|nr:hypothetical protein [Bacteroidales bacterium]